MDETEQPPVPWAAGSPTPWILKVYGPVPRGGYAWLSRGIFWLAVLSLGLFSVTRLLLIHWVFLIPASLGSLSLLGLFYVLLEMRRPPLFSIDVRPEGLAIAESGTLSSRVPLGEIVLEDRPSAHRFLLVRRPGEEVLCEVAREQVRDVSLFETLRRYFSMPSPARPPLSAGGSRSRAARWFLGLWAVIVIVMVLWALYENHAAPRSYEPFTNP